MAVISADDLLALAVRLIAADDRGDYKQVDLRRGISSAYYAVFHTVVTAAADEFVGRGLRLEQASPEHGLVLRSIDHFAIRKLCEDLGRLRVSARYEVYCPPDGFGGDMAAFMAGFPLLQEARHRADYDSLATYTSASATGLVSSAQASIKAFWAAPPAERRLFLFLLLFPPKR